MAPPAVEVDYEDLGENATPYQTAMAGALAGIAEHTLMYPVDAVKTRMQMLTTGAPGVYRGMIYRAMGMANKEGMSSLWRGMSSVVVGAGPAHAVQFVAYEEVAKYLGQTSTFGNYRWVCNGAGGAAAAIANDALMNPFDVVKQRMQLQGSQHLYKSVTDCAKHVYRTEGIRAFYVSYPTTLMTSLPFTALQYLFYGEAYSYINPTGEHSTLGHFTAGGFGGGLAAAITTPTDVIKTMLQTRGTATDPELRNVKGVANGFRVLVRREGLRGLYRGVMPRVIANMPSTAICWACYQNFKKYFVDGNKEENKKQREEAEAKGP
ncbi:mitochondrial carrier domain-containing protein [Calycina marina]|uniref:Mitochondrial carrier domain-containing protein n=1 Tax=Calycina marina TaxID=1763456 RepID=A0A9P7Z655_9HELO|nr:mitochondrial carrier domain-containing protein [Calycina marina]